MTGIGKTPGVLEENLRRHAESFGQQFPGASPGRLFFSPGRVNLMGAHVDYNGGSVLPVALERGTFLAARPLRERILSLATTHSEGVVRFDLGALPASKRGAWSDYPLGVVSALLPRAPSDAAGLEILFGGDLPVGAGLSSSASMCVGTALVLDELWGLGLEPLERVNAALHAEREFVGVQCGIMDPYAIGLGRPDHVLWLDCKDGSFEHIPIEPDAWTLAVVDSGVSRELAAGAYNLRVQECARALEGLRTLQPTATCLRDIDAAVLAEGAAQLDPIARKRAEHVIGDIARTSAAKRALEAGDIDQLGALMFRSHASLRDLYEVSCDELDQLVDDAARVPGVYGARLTGAGFGGCAVVLLRDEARAELTRTLTEGFEARFDRAPRIEFCRAGAEPREVRLATDGS